jgi:hypothetical protein
MIENNEIFNNKKFQSYKIIDELFSKYKSNPYMIEKTYHYVCNQLPNILNNIEQNHINRLERIEELTNEQNTFIQYFLSNNQYFYIPQTEKFVLYDNLHYQLVNEDDIIYNILSSISRDRQIMSWKQKTKINIMKRIKENNIFKSIPESETIQNILDCLSPSIFSTKNEAKYFLTVIGDNIMKKNTNLIHYIDSKSKNFVRELNNNFQMYIGTGFSQTIRHKYHDHSYTECRLIKINDSIKSDYVWNPIINYPILDIVCVACHYSIRYVSSDNFIINFSNDDMLIKNVFYIKDNTPSEIVNLFISEFLEINKEKQNDKPMKIFIDSNSNSTNIRTPQINWKNMQYLWKQFLDTRNLPSVIFLNTLKNILIEKLKDYYNEELDSFVGICSKYLPAIQQFLQFWRETIIFDENETDFEIEELVILFKKWCINNDEYTYNLNDKQILDIISYFFPNIEFEKDKYICGIRSNLWDKQMDIHVALEHLKEIIQSNHYKNNIVNSPSINNNVSIYDAYNFYCKYTSNNEYDRQVVSKSYFEKYIFDNLSNYVIDSKFISMLWYII